MSEYFQYLQKIFIEVFTNIGLWFKAVFADPWGPVPSQFQNYNDILGQYSGNFGFWGWFFYVLFMILLIAFICAILFGLFLLIRKYVKFYRTEIDKDHLRGEVEKLNIELYNMINEKNKILNLKVDSLGIEGGTPGSSDTSDVRFSKLISVDHKYENADTEIVMNDADKVDLNQLCKRFRYFAASQFGLYYEEETIRVLFAGMGTSKLIILEGISGTGKTSLPYALGRFFRNNAALCSVQPSWRDRTELLGYYNEFTHKFTETEFLRAIYESTYRKDNNVIVLDEMNLARIEYYFAEFLSVMEMPNVSEWNLNIIGSPQADDPKHFVQGKLLIPQNCWFYGTANNDDSTFTITDKVYDRAISIFLNNKGKPFQCDFTESISMSHEYLDKLYEEAKTNYPLSAATSDKFAKLDDFVIQNFRIAFGNRILKQLEIFVPLYVACGGTEYGAVDYIFASKILKKFETLNLAFLKDELNELITQLNKLFGKNEFNYSKSIINRYIKLNG